jgi:predicted transposase YbfD/YdcC
VGAIDGKTLRGRFDTARRKNALHLVSAWGCSNGVVLGQVHTEEKSNEIRAIPALLELLDLRQAVVTIDAMGCQKDIAEKIRSKRGDYVLAVKKNQSQLHQDIREAFELSEHEGCGKLKAAFHEEIDSGHGRIEIRRIRQSTNLKWVPAAKDWKGAKSFAMVESERHIGDKITMEIRYFISSLPLDAPRMLAAIRSHWAIENRMHWVLDMTFREDASRVRRGNAAENLSMIRRLVLNICRRNKTGKSNPSKVRRAGWNDDVRTELLLGAGLPDPPGAGTPD